MLDLKLIRQEPDFIKEKLASADVAHVRENMSFFKDSV